MGTGAWQAMVESVEMLGAECLLYSRLGEEPLVVGTEEATVSPALGQTIGLLPLNDRMHHFDATTGRRIDH